MAKILVAEDDVAVAEFVMRALRYKGHAVTVVGDGIAALGRLDVDSFDMLLTDIVMPGLDGIALALKVGRDYPGMRILLMTGYAHERQRAHNLDDLIHRVIAKPFTLVEICDAVEAELAAAQRDATPSVGAKSKGSSAAE